MSSTTMASHEGAAVTNIQVGGNVAGDIIVGSYNLKVNTNYGTIINNAPHEPLIKRREMKPQPPRTPLDFFDRAGELAQIEQLINLGKAVAICGAQGTGKSALLRQAANGNVARNLPDGVLLIEGQDEQDFTAQPEDVVQRLFDAFYLSEPQVKVYTASAQPYLSPLHALLLLDHLSLKADQLRPLLDLLPASPALIARPDALPGLARPIGLGPLPHSDAISLFAVTGGVPLAETTRPALDGICALLNDVPLAVVQTAEVVRQMNLTLEQTCQRLSGAPFSPGEASTIGLSRALAVLQSVLTPLERQVLGIVANLPGSSISTQMIVSISGASARDIQAAVDHLKALGVLHANSPRVSLDPGLRPLLRQTANEGLIRDWLLTQVLADWRNGRFDDDAYCSAELGQVLGTLDWAVQHGRWNDVMTIGHAIDRYLTLHGLWEAWGQVIDRVLQAARAGNNPSTEAWALHQLGTRAASTDRPQAIALLKQALHLRLSNGEITAAAFTQHNIDILIPPLLPPDTSEPGPAAPAAPVASAGMSAALKTMIAIIAIGVVGVVAYLVVRPTGLRLPQGMIVEATDPGGVAVMFNAVATDQDGRSLPVTCEPSSGSIFKIGQTTVTCSAPNQYGLATSGSFLLTVQHVAPPVITLPQPLTLEAVSAAGAVASYAVTARDAVDGPVAVTCDHSSGSTFALGTTTVTCTAADTRGNRAQGSFPIKVQHAIPPGVEVPVSVTVEATGVTGAVADYKVSASDTVDRAAVTCDHPSGSLFPPGSTTVTCTATDEHQNVGHGSFPITVRHTPRVTPADMRLEATSPAGAVGTYAVWASDLVDTATVACVPPSGSVFALDTRTVVTCTATDTQGNTGQGSFQVYVQHTLPPVVPVANMTLEATSPSGATGIYPVSAIDRVDAATVACAPPSGSVFALDTRTAVACTAIDAHRNVGRGSFQIYVQHTIPPVVNVPNNIIEEMPLGYSYYHGISYQQPGLFITYSVSVKDMVDTATVTCAPPPNSFFNPGPTMVTCTATDAHHNVGYGSFQVEVRHTPRVVTSDMVVGSTDPNGAVASYSPYADDAVDTATVTCTPLSGSTFPVGTTTVNCSATDTAGYQGTGTFKVTVLQYAPPIQTPTPTPIPTGILTSIPATIPVLTPTGIPTATPTGAPLPTAIPTPTP